MKRESIALLYSLVGFVVALFALITGELFAYPQSSEVLSFISPILIILSALVLSQGYVVTFRLVPGRRYNLFSLGPAPAFFMIAFVFAIASLLVPASTILRWSASLAPFLGIACEPLENINLRGISFFVLTSFLALMFSISVGL